MLISAQKKCLLDTSVVIENVRKKSSYSPLHKFTLTEECEFPIQEGGGGIRTPNISTVST